MAEKKNIIRLADVGELEADLKKDLAEEEAKGKAADMLFEYDQQRREAEKQCEQLAMEGMMKK